MSCPYVRFADLREESLPGYGYHIARAYWGDLEGLHDWAAERRKDVLNLTQRDFTQYVSRLLGEPGLGEPVGGVGLEVQGVGSARGAVTALPPFRLPGPPAEPAVRLSPQRALHEGDAVQAAVAGS